MVRTLEGDLNAANLKVGIVVARFNSFITEKLLEGAISTLKRHGGSEEDITTAWVPGSFELPLVAKRMAVSGEYHAILCLGCVIKGATSHYDCVVNATTAGIAEAGQSSGIPVILGVITAESIEQAIERAGTKMGNIGANAASAGIEMANLIQQLP